MTNTEFDVGDIVYVLPFIWRGVQKGAGFIGKITLRQLAGSGLFYFHVMEPTGREWHRDASEMILIKKEGSDIMKVYLIHTASSRRYEVVSCDAAAGTITLRGPNGGVFTENYNPDWLKERGYRKATGAGHELHSTD